MNTATRFLRVKSPFVLARYQMANMLTEISEPNISLSEQAYLRLRQEILICNLAPGEVVSERELARRYEMSKTPIREALTQVCREGLMQRLPGRGYMVAPITIKDIRELFDLRLILETAAAERAVQNPSPHLIALLKESSTVSYSFDDPESRVSFLEANRSFHLTLAEAAGNLRLERMLEDLLVEMDRLFHLGLRLRDSSQEMMEEHQEVVAALEACDVEMVRNVLTLQITASQNRIMEAIMRGEIQPVQISE